MCNAIANVFPASVLYVRYASFDAHRQGNDLVVEWSTTHELNEDAFEMRYYRPGMPGHLSLATVAAKGNSSTRQHYRVSIANAPAEAGYCYLRTRNHDGLSENLSPHLHAFVPAIERPGVHVAASGSAVTFRAGEATEALELSIYNLHGQLVHRGRLNERIVLSSTQLGSGVFIYRLADTTQAIKHGRFVLLPM